MHSYYSEFSESVSLEALYRGTLQAWRDVRIQLIGDYLSLYIYITCYDIQILNGDKVYHRQKM